MAAIDAFLPEWDAHEVHSVVLAVPPARALAAALETPAAPDVVVRVLLKLRGLRVEGSIEELLAEIGLGVLTRRSDEVVFGGAGTPWRPGGGLAAFAEARAGTVRIAANFRVEPLPDGRTRLSTETRIAAVDAVGRAAFRRYWRAIGPFSSLIRRRWLAAVRRSITG